MKTTSGRTLVGMLLGIVLSMGSVVWISGERMKPAQALKGQIDGQGIAQVSIYERANGDVDDTGPATVSSKDESYIAGYHDGWRDAVERRNASQGSSSLRSPALRSSVAGSKYNAHPRRGHSTRNTILTIAAPAGAGAGVGAIGGGKKAAGAGALLGGGAGALYHLIRNRR